MISTRSRTARYTPEDVFRFAKDGNTSDLILALNQGDNSTNWHRNEYGRTALHAATNYNRIKCVEILLERGFNVNSKDSSGLTALHRAARNDFTKIVKILLESEDIDINCSDKDGDTALYWAARYNQTSTVEMLLAKGIDIDNDINKYTLFYFEDEDEDGNLIIMVGIPDCRPLIFAEVENRRKRALFDSFINRHIEYQPYINDIYTRCYPTGNVKVSKPPLGWTIAEAVRDKYYLDEVFFYLHLHVANCYMNTQPDAITTISSVNSVRHNASNSDTTFTLMTILTDRLRLMLKPDQNLGVEVPYVQTDN